MTSHQLSRQFGTAALEQTWFAYVAPLKLGPYIKQSGVSQVGQWGMIAPSNKTSKPNGQTNNARRESLSSRITYSHAWLSGQRCIIPAASFVEPYYPGHDPKAKSISWRFARADGDAWALAGIWSEWQDKETGEICPSYSMITQNCDGHPLLSLMHKPEVNKAGEILPANQQDKRAVVPLERDRWDEWLHGSVEQAESLIQLPTLEVFMHGASDPLKNVRLPGAASKYQLLQESPNLI